ncbi:hypothetical protein RRG08_008368 [Elysia crispata]|uniref:Uncharacterized protein n=1 Tax=Elysia crispata TaxID=231223 RepID=A0AAE0Z3Q4_9GAST|nr:hypothetical protein RRG08_008368 [Elysia crispata]
MTTYQLPLRAGAHDAFRLRHFLKDAFKGNSLQRQRFSILLRTWHTSSFHHLTGQVTLKIIFQTSETDQPHTFVFNATPTAHYIPLNLVQAFLLTVLLDHVVPICKGFAAGPHPLLATVGIEFQTLPLPTLLK